MTDERTPTPSTCGAGAKLTKPYSYQAEHPCLLSTPEKRNNLIDF